MLREICIGCGHEFENEDRDERDRPLGIGPCCDPDARLAALTDNVPVGFQLVTRRSLLIEAGVAYAFQDVGIVKGVRVA